MFVEKGLPGATGGSGGSSRFFARITDVITDAFHPQYEYYGESQALNGIFFLPLGNDDNNDPEEDNFRFAYQAGTSMKEAPLRGEIVQITLLPFYKGRDGAPKAAHAYWERIVPIWNHPNHNALPPKDEENDFGDNFEESDEVNPLQPFPGDVIIEGRHANTIRLGGTKHEENPIVDDSNNGKPYSIIRVGQTDEVEDGSEAVVEDINKDLASIYMMSDHEIPIEPANEKRDSYDEEPDKPDKFKGEQILVNSNRLFLNAKEDSILMSAGSSVGANAETINLDGDKMVSLDGKKIYLGVAALKNEDEPVLKGQTSIEWMEMALKLYEILIDTMVKMPPVPAAAVAQMKATAASIKPQIAPHAKRVKTLLSKKVFTE